MIELVLLTAIIIVHSANGNEVSVNAKQITSMHAALPSDSQHFGKGVRCSIHLTDGKFVAVVETCEQVRSLIAAQPPMRRNDP